MFGLNYLVAPLNVDEFLGQIYGRRATYIPGDKAKFAGLADWEAINSILDSTRNGYEGCRLVYEKKELARKEFSNLKSWLGRGATVVINHFDQVDPIVNRFNAILSRDLNTRINTNGYISFPTKQGFDNHFDRHDVFVLQTEGTKLWNVFEPTYEYPMHMQDAYLEKGEPPQTDSYIEVEMTPGDVLYIPRGHWHYAISTTPSAHLTVGPQSRTPGEFLQWMVYQFINNDVSFRRDFDIADVASFGGRRSDAALDQQIQAFIESIQSRLDPVVLKESLLRYCMGANPAPEHYQLPSAWNLKQSISPQTVFLKNDEQKAIVRYDEERQTGIAYIRGHVLELDSAPGSLLEYLFGDSAEVTGSRMLEISNLEWKKLSKILVQLYSVGYLVLDDQAS